VVERLSSLLSIAIAGTHYRPIRKPFGITAFAVNAYTAERAGDLVIEAHDELGSGSGRHEELYVVMTGAATFEVDGEAQEAPAGSFVFVRPEQRRSAHATADDTTILVVGGKPGAAGPPSPFEYWYFATPAYDAGEFDRAYEIAAEGLEHYDDNASLHYNLACYAALGGHRERAQRHLERAFELNPKTREWAAKDEDLADL
jgi:tetratricopeptide (TPR) repeat protein